MAYSRNDDDKHLIASARRLLSFMPPKPLERIQGAGVANENPGPDVALTIVYRTYGNPHQGGHKLKISHFVLDPLKLNQLERDLKQVVATEVKRFHAVEGRGRENWGEDHVTRVRVHPQAIVEISSNSLTPPQLRAILESLDLDGLAQSCRDGTIFERTTLDRLSDSLIDPESMERLLPARIGVLVKTKVWSRRQREDPFIRTYATASYPRPGEPADSRDGDKVWVFDYGKPGRIQIPLERDWDISNVHFWLRPRPVTTKLDSILVHYTVTGRRPVTVAACAALDRFVIEYRGQFIEGEGFVTPEDRIKAVIRLTAQTIDKLRPTSTLGK